MQHLLSRLGPVTAVIGAQWGDEGKGKIVDLLAEHFDVIARASGGANAGHTIVVGGKKHVFHLLPAGSLHEGKAIILGSGMVIHLPTLLEEIETLKNAGIDIVPRLSIARAAHIVLDYHREIDAKLEEERALRSAGTLGTTKRGIGPAYTEKAARTGMRMEQLLLSEADLRANLEERRAVIARRYGITVNVQSELIHLLEARSLLKDHVSNMTILLHLLQTERKRILIEGAQGTLLDIDHGTYPFVTSSATTSAGALQGLGLPPKALTSCIGVAKAYCTRVGSGPFPTEAEEPAAARLRERGGEYGATTGRPRRCGWLSLDDLTFAAAVNGFTHLNLTKLDVLDEEEMIPVFHEVGAQHAVPLPGWKESTRGITSFAELPANARAYIERIEQTINVPVAFIGTGPEREAMIVR